MNLTTVNNAYIIDGTERDTTFESILVKILNTKIFWLIFSAVLFLMIISLLLLIFRSFFQIKRTKKSKFKNFIKSNDLIKNSVKLIDEDVEFA